MRQMLTGIRVETKSELEERIYQYFDEINSFPVPYKWKYKMETIDLESQGKRTPIPHTRKLKKEIAKNVLNNSDE